MTIKDLLKVANTKKEYLVEDKDLTIKTNGLFKYLVIFFQDNKGNECYDPNFNPKKIESAYVIIKDIEMVHAIPNVSLDTTIEGLFNYTYIWYGLERGVK